MSAANLSIGGGDPRLSISSGAGRNEKLGDLSGGEGISDYTRANILANRDPNVTFDEYYYYANLARAEEDASTVEEPPVGLREMFFPSKNNKSLVEEKVQRNLSVSSKENGAYKQDGQGPGYVSGANNISEEEWINAQRSIRTASGAAAFYLITTDVLGPFGLPYSFATTGWVPGIVLFTIFAVMAGYGGYLLNRMFLWTDSFRYPTRSYGDVAYRIYGQWARIPLNFLQSIQLILTVSLITISNGQALYVITKFNLCYIVAVVILVVCGMVIGQIRTLQKFGWLANVAVFMNVFIMIFTMAVAAHSPPFYSGAGVESAGGVIDGPRLITPDDNGVFPPIQHSVGVPYSPSGFIAALNGAGNAVFAYGGANVFNEFMAEMRRPRDFLKSMWAAQFFIWFVYMFYGLFMYGYQGQYSINPSPQSVSPYWALIVANIFYILSAMIAACLYGNIGLKVIYNNIFVELFRFPSLTTKAGKIIWVILIPIYWAVAFVIGAAIPDFGALVGVVGAICIVQFTYSVPPMFYVGYKIKLNALQPGEGFDPATKTVIHHDRGFKRFLRGLFGGTKRDKLQMAWNLIYIPAALALAGLAAYASIEGIIEAVASGGETAFSCTSPLKGAFAQGGFA